MSLQNMKRREKKARQTFTTLRPIKRDGPPRVVSIGVEVVFVHVHVHLFPSQSHFSRAPCHGQDLRVQLESGRLLGPWIELDTENLLDVTISASKGRFFPAVHHNALASCILRLRDAGKNPRCWCNPVCTCPHSVHETYHAWLD